MKKIAPSPKANKQTKTSEEIVVENINLISSPDAAKWGAMSTIINYKNEVPDLAVYLWFSSGTITILFTEFLTIIQDYDEGLKTESLHNLQTIMSLFYIISSDDRTKVNFIESNIPFYFIPIMDQCLDSPNQIRISAMCLSVFAALAQNSIKEVMVKFVELGLLSICTKYLQNSPLELKIAASHITYSMINSEHIQESIFQTPDQVSLVLFPLLKIFSDLSQSFNKRLSQYVVPQILILFEKEGVIGISIKFLYEKMKSKKISGEYDQQYLDLVDYIENEMANAK